MKSGLFLIAFLSVFWKAWLDDMLIVEGKNFSKVNRTVKLSLTSRKNQTGHSVTHFMINKSSMELPDSWNMDIEHRFTEESGLISVLLCGVITAPPPVPVDYELFPRIGYYKYHQESAANFDAASAACLKEGCHLAIINSPAESEVMKLLWSPHPETKDFKHLYAFIGIHDRLKENDFVTIFGHPLNTTGFTKWAGYNTDNHNNNEDCGSVTRVGQLNDVHCGLTRPFICEYDLSWIE